MIASFATWLSNLGASLVRGSIAQGDRGCAEFLPALFLRDRRAAGSALRAWLPLTHAETDRLFTRVIDTVHATIYGTVAVAVVQGTLAGLMFWILDLPTPRLWGQVMGLLAIVPVLGEFVVWIPAGNSPGVVLWSWAGSTISCAPCS